MEVRNELSLLEGLKSRVLLIENLAESIDYEEMEDYDIPDNKIVAAVDILDTTKTEDKRKQTVVLFHIMVRGKNAYKTLYHFVPDLIEEIDGETMETPEILVYEILAEGADKAGYDKKHQAWTRSIRTSIEWRGKTEYEKEKYELMGEFHMDREVK